MRLVDFSVCETRKQDSLSPISGVGGVGCNTLRGAD